MELSLERVDLTQVQTTCRKTMRLLPLGKKRQQKVVVGDETGSLLCFGMKKTEVERVFKTPVLGKEASRVELGGEAAERDKIFMASSGTIGAFTKKGKQFLQFNTNLTEPIKSMWVGEEDIHTGGEYMYNTFINCKDTYFFMSNDRINDLVCQVGAARWRHRALRSAASRVPHVCSCAARGLGRKSRLLGPAATTSRPCSRARTAWCASSLATTCCTRPRWEGRCSP